MLHEAGMLDTACKSDLIVNGRVNNQSSAASLITHELLSITSLPLPLLAWHNLETDTAMPRAIALFI